MVNHYHSRRFEHISLRKRWTKKTKKISEVRLEKTVNKLDLLFIEAALYTTIRV